MDLNPLQREVVAHGDGPLQVVAGPGTGKTRVVTERIVRLVTEGKVPPERILALTFTEKAAEEMAGRVRASLAEAGVRGAAAVSTFHAFCLDLVKEHAETLGYDGVPKLLVGPLYVQFLVQNVDRMVTDNTDLVGKVPRFARALAEFVSYCHDEGLVAEDLVPRVEAWIDSLPARDRRAALKVRDLAASVPRVLALQRERGVVSYGDLLTDAVRLLAEHPEVRADVAARWDHVFVDEFQDDNRAQAKLVGLLAPHGNLVVVGDEDQSIYRFRGARMELMEEFRKAYAPRVVALAENYRSTAPIVDASQALVRHNRQRFGDKVVRKAVASTVEGPEAVDFVVAPDDAVERRWIVREVVRRLAGGLPPGDVAILVRSLLHGDQLAADLRRAGVAVEVVGGRGMFTNPVVREVVAWLKALDDPVENEAALHRVLRFSGFGLSPADQRALGQAAKAMRLPLVDAVRTAAADGIPTVSPQGARRLAGFVRTLARFEEESRPRSTPDVGGLVEDVLRLGGLAHRLAPTTARGRRDLAAIGALLSAARTYEEHYPWPSLHGFVRFLDLLEDLGQDDTVGEPSTDRATVKLMTVHQAKGREFPVVLVPFLCRYPPENRREWDEKFLDAVTLAGDPAEAHLEEERRVLYVAMSRAMRELVLSTHRVRAGKPVEPSPFEAELESCAAVRRVAVLDVPDDEGPTPLATREAVENRLHRLVSLLGTGQAGPGAVGEVLRLVGGLVADSAGEEAARGALRALGLADDVEVRFREPEPPPGLEGPLHLSASQLNAYAECPRRWYYERVVKVPQRSDDGPRDSGKAAHAALEEFFRRHPRADPAFADELVALVEHHASGLRFAADAERRQWIERLSAVLAAYLREEAARPGAVVDVERKFALDLGDGVVVNGVIDRVDELPDGRLRVVDYKTGRLKSGREYLEEDFQMPVYALAVLETFGKPLAEVEVVGLKELKQLQKGPAVNRVTLAWEDGSKNALTKERLDGVRRRIRGTVEAVRAGRFDATPSESACGRCDFAILCDRAWGVEEDLREVVVEAAPAGPRATVQSRLFGP